MSVWFHYVEWGNNPYRPVMTGWYNFFKEKSKYGFNVKNGVNINITSLTPALPLMNPDKRTSCRPCSPRLLSLTLAMCFLLLRGRRSPSGPPKKYSLSSLQLTKVSAWYSYYASALSTEPSCSLPWWQRQVVGLIWWRCSTHRSAPHNSTYIVAILTSAKGLTWCWGQGHCKRRHRTPR